MCTCAECLGKETQDTGTLRVPGWGQGWGGFTVYPFYTLNVVLCEHFFIQKVNLKDVESPSPPLAPLGPAEKGSLTRDGQGASSSMPLMGLKGHITRLGLGLGLGQVVFCVWGWTPGCYTH